MLNVLVLDFKYWGVEQNSIPYMWQVIFSYISFISLTIVLYSQDVAVTQSALECTVM